MTRKRLRSDSKRQAVDAIRGYVYQIYQSVFAWITLRDGKLLVLETAEDFEVYANGAVETTQIKDTAGSGTVTLRRPGVVDAINNYWRYRQSNPEYEVQFRFLTTSVPGLEKGKPFGQKVKGLEYWERTKNLSVPLRPLIDFLLTLNVHETVKIFLRESDEADVRDLLIRPIHWDTGQRPIEALQQVIDDRLTEHGLNLSVPAHHAIRARATLLEKVVETVIQPDNRCLRFSDFALAFEDVTGNWEPRARQEAAKHEALAKTGLYQETERDPLADLILAPPVFDKPRPLVQGALQRRALVENFIDILEQNKTLCLRGSTGVGKTTLARLLVDATDHDWLWGAFRGVAPTQVGDRLSRATHYMNLKNLQPYVVLDDLDFGELAVFEHALLGLVFGALTSGGRVIITSQTKPPSLLLAKLWLTPACGTEVPYFSEDEISDLVIAHGCTDTEAARMWATLIWLTTRGHPQLVHARVRLLQTQRWPQPKTEDLVAPIDVQEVKKHAQRRLVAELPSQATRTFAYRLSILTSTFTRERAMVLADIPPPVQLPGEALDVLVGPWIEEESNNLYRVSPLLSGAAQNALSATEMLSLHEAVALSFVKQGSISGYEVSTALMHALAAKSVVGLSFIAKGLLKVSRDDWRVAADYLFWFAAVAMEPGQKIFEPADGVNVMLRAVQFRVAANLSDKQKAIAVAQRWLQELQDVQPQELQELSRLHAYAEILIAHKVPFRPRFIIELIPELVALNDRHKEPEVLEGLGRLKSGKHLDLVASFMLIEVARIDGAEDLNEFLDALEQLPEPQRRNLIKAFDIDLADQLIGRAWLPEVSTDTEDIERCTTVLRRAAQLGQTWGAESLALAAYVAIAVLYDEYQQKSKEAHSMLDEAEALFGKDRQQLLNQRAKVFFGQEKYTDALTIWQLLLANDPQDSMIEYIFATRLAGIAAANLRDWEKAGEFFEKGARLCTKVDVPVSETMHVGFLGDAALALWKQEKRKQALMALATILVQLEKLTSLADLRIRAVHAKVRHAMGWMYSSIREHLAHDHTEPLPGMMSSPEIDERAKDWQIAPMSFVWALLRNIEAYLDLSLGIRARADERTGAKAPLMLHAMGRFDQVEKAFKAGKSVDLVCNFIELAEALVVEKLTPTKGVADKFTLIDIPPLPEDYWQTEANIINLLYFLLAGAVAQTARTPQTPLPADKWRKDALAVGVSHRYLDRYLSIAKGSKELAREDVPYEQALKALLRLREEQLSPNELFRSHFYLISILSQSEWGQLVAHNVEQIVATGWRYASEHQRFGLRMPSSSAPRILEACNDNTHVGFGKASRILLVASQGVNVALRNGAKEGLERLAKGPEGDSPSGTGTTETPP